MAEGVRKRGGGAPAGKSTMYKEDIVDAVDDEEGKPLTGQAPWPDEGHSTETFQPPKSATSTGTVSKATFKVGMVIEKIREMDMDDVYRYWSVLQHWLADVPSKLGTRCPPLAGLGLTRPPDLTEEQLEKLDSWCECNVAIPCTREDHADLLIQLWNLSFPESDVNPELPDP
jgi:hypothetical protein